MDATEPTDTIRMLNRPPAFPEEGGVVRVVHPSGALGPHLERVAAGVAALESAGCTVLWDGDAARRDWRGYLAGDDETRAEELVGALTEPGVDAVWIARGGSGAQRILRRVLSQLVDVPPRLLVGFSDATTLLNGLAFELGWTGVHGPVVASLAEGGPDVDAHEVLAVMRGDGVRAAVPHGRLLGGNLTVLASLVGVLSRPVGSVVWLLEDVAEPRYKLDRCITQLREAGWFRDGDRFWLGNFGDVPSAVVAEMLRGDVNGCHVDGCAPAGHAGTIRALPLGAVVGRIEGGFAPVEPWVNG